MLKQYIYIAENLFVRSRYSRPKEPVKDHLLNPEDAKIIGTYALDRVNEEFKELTTKTISGEYRDNCCDMWEVYGLPCKHLILARMQEKRKPYLYLDDFDPRWFHNYNYNIIPRVANTVSIRQAEKIKDTDWTYKACIDRFEKYFTIAKISNMIQQILMEALSQLQSLEQESDNMSVLRPLKSLLISGAPDKHPRNNVDRPGARRTKRKNKK